MLNSIDEILDNCHTQRTNMSPTLLYNEGWMIRVLVAASIEKGLNFSEISFSEIDHWYSEGLLSSPFLPQIRKDVLAEGYTHADMAIW
jgi:hypothetical protein